MKNGHRQLAAAVISRAVLDLADAMEIPQKRKAPKALRNGQTWQPETPEEYAARVDWWKNSWWRGESALFLTAESGEWARSRKFWCEAAGMSSSALRDKCHAMILKARAGAIRQVQAKLRGTSSC